VAGIDVETRMTIKTLSARGAGCAEIGRLLSLPESNVRYHLRRMAEGRWIAGGCARGGRRRWPRRSSTGWGVAAGPR